MIKVESFTIQSQRIDGEINECTAIEARLMPVGGMTTVTELLDIPPTNEFMLVPATYDVPLQTVIQAIENMPSLDDVEKEYLKQELEGMIERYSNGSL